MQRLVKLVFKSISSAQKTHQNVAFCEHRDLLFDENFFHKYHIYVFSRLSEWADAVLTELASRTIGRKEDTDAVLLSYEQIRDGV